MAKQELTIKEQVFTELEKIYDMYKDLEPSDRICSYVDYFVNN